ncbi:hypothetical protein [Vibrio sonorensis]|uniref:hypothetical protein n=1 Tax=Vibrio sonorensis TaxID=1004316 RepID=UPI0008DA4FE6|nr:hypothetical protein [Vibrio sonorensis]
MSDILGLALFVCLAVTVCLWKMKVPLKHLVILMGFTFVALIPLAYLTIDLPPEKLNNDVSAQNIDTSMQDLQQLIKDDPNQWDLWYELGQGYLASQEFSSASTCFEYALRLSDRPTANLYASKATALYYDSGQSMNREVQRLLSNALELDSTHPASLNLIASDHYVSLRFEKAAQVWFQILDSGRTDFDRANIIKRLAQAKSMSG